MVFDDIFGSELVGVAGSHAEPDVWSADLFKACVVRQALEEAV